MPIIARSIQAGGVTLAEGQSFTHDGKSFKIVGFTQPAMGSRLVLASRKLDSGEYSQSRSTFGVDFVVGLIKATPPSCSVGGGA